MSWLWVRPPGRLLDRIRWFYSVFAVVFAVTFLPQLLIISHRPLLLRLVAAAGLALLIAWWLRGRTAQRFPLAGLALEVPVYVLLAMGPADPLRAFGLVFLGVIFRSLYGRWTDVAAFVVPVVVAFGTVLLVVPGYTPYLGPFLQAIVAAPALAVISHLTAEAIQRRERATAREHELAVASLALARAVDRAELRRTAERSVAALLPGCAVAVALRETEDTRHNGAVPVVRDEDELVLPLDGRDGLIGHLVVAVRGGVPMESRDALQALAHAVGQSLSALRLHDDLRARAETDALTGLANRAALQQRLASLGTDGTVEVVGRTAGGHAPCLVVVDLDDFKLVNDTHGHGAGDAVLVETGQRLRDAVRQGDLVARLGGDEFAVVIDCGLGEALIDEVIGRIRASLTRPIRVGPGVTVRIGASVGRARWTAATPADTLLLLADADMYLDKRARHAAPGPRSAGRATRSDAATP